MNRLAVGLTAFFLVLVTSEQSSPQKPVPSTIEGSVLQVGSNQPIANAEITLLKSSVPSTTPTPPGFGTSTSELVTTTDAAGKFLFRDLAPGSYQLFAAHNGFVRQEYGQKSPFHAGTLIIVSANQSLRDVVLYLTPAGTVTGRVNDADGAPLQGMNVQLLRIAYDSDGNRILRPVANAITNDLGEYRLYWVTPGRYVMNVDPSRSTLEMEFRSRSSGVVAGNAAFQAQIDMLRGKNEVVDQNYAVTYYPGTPDSSKAVAIEVRSALELSGINLTVPRIQRFVVAGHLVDAGTGNPTGRTGAVGLKSLDPLKPSIPTSSFNASTGAFEIRNVLPGSYVLEATMLAADPSKTLSSTVRSRIEVVDRDVDSVVQIRYGTTVSGRLDIEGQAIGAVVPDSNRITVSLLPMLLPSLGGTRSAKIASNGSFTIENVTAGEYRVGFSGLPQNGYIRSASLGIKDQLKEPIAVGVMPPESLVISMSLNAGQILGSVFDRNRIAAPGIQVVLIPNQDRDRHELYRAVVADESGQFAIRGIAPGDYKLFAWEDLEPFAYFDPDILQNFEAQGWPAHVVESSNLTATVTEIVSIH